MGIYSDTKINQIINKKDIVIYPYKDENLTGIGYDIRVGIIQPLSKIPEFSEDDDFYYIPPNSYCVVISKEFVWLSHRLAATLHARGTLAAKGLYTNSTNIDPNFKGQLIMSLFNVSEKTIKIGKDEHYITMIVQSVVKSTKTLIDTDIKNSIRVTTHFKEIYGNEVDQQTSNLHEYLATQNNQNGGYFQELITVARNTNPFKHFSFRDFLKKIFSIRGLIWLILISIIVIIFFHIYNTEFKSENFKWIEFSALIVGLLTALVVLVNEFKRVE